MPPAPRAALTVIVAKDGYVPVVRTVRIRAGGTVRPNVTLQPESPC